MGNILDKVREAIKNKNSQKDADDKKDPFKIGSSEEDKIREFETRLDDMRDIMGRLRGGEIEMRDIKEEIRKKTRDITE